MENIKHYFYPDSKQTSRTQNFKSNWILMYVTFLLYTCNWNSQHRLATRLRISAFSWSRPQPHFGSGTRAFLLWAWHHNLPDPLFCLILVLLWQQTNQTSLTPVSTGEIRGGPGELTALTRYLDTSTKASTLLVFFSVQVVKTHF